MDVFLFCQPVSQEESANTFSTLPQEQESTRSVSEKAFSSTESVVRGENDNEIIMSFALVEFFFVGYRCLHLCKNVRQEQKSILSQFLNKQNFNVKMCNLLIGVKKTWEKKPHKLFYCISYFISVLSSDTVTLQTTNPKRWPAPRPMTYFGMMSLIKMSINTIMGLVVSCT